MDAAVRPVPPTWAVVIALGALYLIWGSTYYGIRVGLEGYPPFLMGGIRFVAAASLLFAVLWLRGGLVLPTAPQWRNAAVMGLLMMLLGNGLVNVAEQEVSSGVAAIAVASMPLWAGLFSWLKGRSPTRLEWLGLGIGFAGVVALNAGAELSASPTGAFALLMAPIAWAWGSVWSRGRDLPSPFVSTAAQMLCGGLAMLALGLVLGERITAVPPLSATLAVAYLALFGSIVGFGAYVWLLDHVRPALATSYAYVNPPIAVLLGVMLGGERFAASELVAMAVILGSVVLITRARR